MIVRGLATPDICVRIRDGTRHELDAAIARLEYEASIGYPGAQASFEVEGGYTVRGLPGVIDRYATIHEWTCPPAIVAQMSQLLGSRPVLSRAHHNCLMSKHPKHGSQTNWYRDFRYWSFERPELISLWLDLGPERAENCGMLVLPGGQRLG